MNQREFRRALRYGFGRAILHLQQHDAARYRDDILDACLHDWDFLILRYPHGLRSDYMSEIISLTGERAFYRDHILAAVASARDDLDGHHVFALARRFADEGDEAAREALDRALERLPFDDDLAKQAISLHGPAGLARVMRLRLNRLDADCDNRAPDDIIGWWVIDDATERWGKRAVAATMRDAGRADPRIKALWTAVRQRVAQGRQEWETSSQGWKTSSHTPPLTSEQVMQILANPNVGRGFRAGHWSNHWSRALRTWRETAPDDEWRRLAAELADLPDDDPRWQRAVDYLYDRRAYPGDPHRLIATVRAARLDRHLDSPNENDTERSAWTTRRAGSAMDALAQMTHPAVRSFALELLETSKWTGKAASLLLLNYVDGDLELLAAVFRRERSEWQRHAIGNVILGIDERFAPTGAPPVLLLLYELVPCFECREWILQRLHAHAALPAAIAAECCFDADDTVRERIAELVPGVCTGSGD